jgi:serine protease Do
MRSSIFRALAALGLAAAGISAQPVLAPTPPPLQAPSIFYYSGSPASYIGVGFRDIDKERMKALNLREERGVEITRVDADSPAGKAGLQLSDVVLEYNGQRVESSETFLRFVRETPAGRDVKLTVSRNGQILNLGLTTAVRKARKMTAGPGDEMRIDIPPFELPEIRMLMPDAPRANMSWRNGSLGVETEALEGALAEFFGVKEGVLVRGVGPGTPAEKAGLKAGDVITKIDSERVAKAGNITAYLRNNAEKKTFNLTVMREKREISVPVTVEPAQTPARSFRGTRVSNQ